MDKERKVDASIYQVFLGGLVCGEYWLESICCC